MQQTQPENNALGEFLTAMFGKHKITQRRSDGFLNATEMCKVEPGKKFNDFSRLKKTQKLITALSVTTGFHAKTLIESITGPYGGSWIHPRVAIPFAYWLSVEFSIFVCDLTERFITGDLSLIEEVAERHRIVHPEERVLATVTSGPLASESVPAAHVAAASAAAAEAAQKIEELKSELEGAKSKLSAAEATLSTTKGSLQTTKGALQATQSTLQATKGALQTAEGSLQATKGALQTAEGTLQATQSTLQATKGTLKRTNRDLQNTKRTLLQSDRKRIWAHDTINSISDSLNQLRAKYAAAVHDSKRQKVRGDALQCAGTALYNDRIQRAPDSEAAAVYANEATREQPWASSAPTRYIALQNVTVDSSGLLLKSVRNLNRSTMDTMGTNLAHMNVSMLLEEDQRAALVQKITGYSDSPFVIRGNNILDWRKAIYVCMRDKLHLRHSTEMRLGDMLWLCTSFNQEVIAQGMSRELLVVAESDLSTLLQVRYGGQMMWRPTLLLEHREQPLISDFLV